MLSNVITSLQGTKRLVAALDQQQQVRACGLHEGARFYLAGALRAQWPDQPLVVLCETEKRAKRLWEEFGYLFPGEEIHYFPALEMIPFEVLAKSYEIEHIRLQVLGKLATGMAAAPVIVTTTEALIKGLLPPDVFAQGCRQLQVGERLDVAAFKAFLVQVGYRGVDQVDHIGEFAMRGGIIDIYTPLYPEPIRLELFDDEIDSLRFFAIDSQRSQSKHEALMITPAYEFFLTDEVTAPGLAALRDSYEKQKNILTKYKSREPLERLQQKVGEVIEAFANAAFLPVQEQYQRFFYPEAGTLLDYLAPNGLVVVDESNRIRESLALREKERSYQLSELLLQGQVLPEQGAYFLTSEALVEVVARRKIVAFSLLPDSQGAGQALLLSGGEVPEILHQPEVLPDMVGDWLRAGYGVLALASSQDKAERLVELLHGHGLATVRQGDEPHFIPGKIGIAHGDNASGAIFADDQAIILSEQDLFRQGSKNRRKKLFQDEGERLQQLADLAIGDYVVHTQHGIGCYLGMENITVGDIQKDYLIIKYRGADKLYVPVEQFSYLHKYIGQEDKPPKVNKLSGNDWQKTKAKVQAAVAQLADDLLAIYARRASQPGHAFPPDDDWQRGFEAAFPYVETEDQLQAIADVKADMMRPIVMDRLVCGDVGYGKTEVAIRAAFKAVGDNKQVAVLVPTTVLAQQHYNTIYERFAPYGVKVALLNRFRPLKEQNATIRGLAEGTVDVVIGTHKLLNEKIKFADLGLLVIDEEQRFGVSHKEKIKTMRHLVDVLTLSATPIPRTLHMSLVGIRDMSLIETPPEDRYPIQTYIVEHSMPLVEEAIRREMGREGQVFYVYNRIDELERIAAEISTRIPEARVVTAHGRMRENELEEIMLGFINHEMDVLVCTTIIETGIDIANVNTLIIDRADHMGLSQLYQLRGRVGRSNRVAYAYLTYRPERTLTPLAEKRLNTLREYTALGSGFRIAMRDLEIRGAGNLLGAEQHGQVGSVGFDLYTQLLDDAIRQAKGQQIDDEADVEMDFPITAYIPDYYIRDSATKLAFYQRIQKANTEARLIQLDDELVDRFGDVPREMQNLLRVAELKIFARQSHVSALKQKGGLILFHFSTSASYSIAALSSVVGQFRPQLSYGNTGGELVLKLNIGSKDTERCLDLMKDVLTALQRLEKEV